MSLIKEKKIEIGKLVLVWDWFELTKWLNFLNGILCSVGLMIIFMFEKGIIQEKKATAIFLVVTCFILIGVVGYAVNLIRKDSLQ